jgi:hypothetical protein
LRQAAALARENYSGAVETNVGMWSIP